MPLKIHHCNSTSLPHFPKGAFSSQNGNKRLKDRNSSLLCILSSNEKESCLRPLRFSSWIMVETESRPSAGREQGRWQQQSSHVLLLKEHPSCIPCVLLCSYGHPPSLAVLPCTADYSSPHKRLRYKYISLDIISRPCLTTAGQITN